MITTSCKISTSGNYIIIESEEKKKIFIGEIDVIMIESQAVVLTVPAINILAKNNVNVIYCGDNHNPLSFSAPIYGNHLQSKNLLEQINWTSKRKEYLWKKIIEAKIRNQYHTLKKYFPDSNKLEMIKSHATCVEIGDATNREGMVAKVYFKEMFGKDFTRTSEEVINSVLNYAYAILASSFSRVIISRGYLTDMGIHHKSVFNHFNFTYDLLEPYRPIIDYYVTQLIDFERMDSHMKKRIILIFNNKVKVGNKKYFFNNSIDIYLTNVFDVLNCKTDSIDFPMLENYEL